MNNARRKKVAKAYDMIQDLVALLEEIRDEEQEAYANLPENLRDSEKGELMEDTVYRIESAIDDLDCAERDIEDVIQA